MNYQTMIEIFAAIFLCDGFWRLIERRYAKKDVKARAILALLHDKIYYLCERHIQRGEITVDELENLTCLYEPYKEMGGNGTCERLYGECSSLPKRPT